MMGGDTPVVQGGATKSATGPQALPPALLPTETTAARTAAGLPAGQVIDLVESSDEDEPQPDPEPDPIGCTESGDSAGAVKLCRECSEQSGGMELSPRGARSPTTLLCNLLPRYWCSRVGPTRTSSAWVVHAMVRCCKLTVFLFAATTGNYNSATAGVLVRRGRLIRRP